MVSKRVIDKTRAELERAKRDYEEAENEYNQEVSSLRELELKYEQANSELDDIRSDISRIRNELSAAFDEARTQIANELEQARKDRDRIIQDAERTGRALLDAGDDDLSEAIHQADAVISDAEHYEPDADRLVAIADRYRNTKRRLDNELEELQQRRREAREARLSAGDAVTQQEAIVQQKKGILSRLKAALERLVDRLKSLMTTDYEPPAAEPWHQLSDEERIIEYERLCTRIGLGATTASGTLEQRLEHAKQEMINAVQQKANDSLNHYCQTREEIRAARETMNAYSRLLNAYATGNYENTQAAYEQYLSDIDVADDVKQVLIQGYTRKKFNACPPPVVFLFTQDMRIANEGAFHNENVIYLNKDSSDWMGSPETAGHESGHAWDFAELRGENVWDGDVDNEITKIVKQEQKRFNKRGAKFTLFGEEIPARAWKSHFSIEGDYMIASPSLIEHVDREIIRQTGWRDDDPRIKEVRMAIFDTFQSILGYEFGSGHGIQYCLERKNSGSEAIANIHMMITMGYDFLKEPFPMLWNYVLGRLK